MFDPHDSPSSSGGVALLSDPEAETPATVPGWPRSGVPLPRPEELEAMLSPWYEVEAFIGRGGMGAVYRGVQLPLRRQVAIKILPTGMNPDAAFEERFKHEAYAMAALVHPNIVHVYDCGNAGEDFLFISMELVEGGDVSAAMRAGE